MSKAVLILDEMPEECEDCPLFYTGDFGRECQLVNIKGQKKPKWCPLKKLPEHAPENHLTKEDLDREFYDSRFAFDCGHAQGWNDCLDEISGKEDTDGQTEDL